MKYLLDTHALIWWLDNSQKLSSLARKAISNPENSIFVSHASYWEISTKVSLERLVFPIEALDSELQKNSFQLLPIKTAHIIQTLNLPMHHRDPFDRMLITQAQVENIIVLTLDPNIQKYDLLWEW